MRFMVLVQPGDPQGYENGAMPSDELIDNMLKYNEELIKAGIMKGGDGLHPSSKGARLHFSGGNVTYTDGPFAESKELIGGFWLWEVKSKEEAIEWAKRAPMEDGATLEVRQLFEPADFGPEVEARENKLIAEMESQKNK